jgi:hypothetical protein
MSIEKAVREALQDGIPSVTNDNITFGISEQSASFPNITFEITSKEPKTIGQRDSGPRSSQMIMLEILSCDLNASAVANIYEQVETTLKDSIGQTWDGDNVFEAVHRIESIIESPSYSNGDESAPYIARTTAELWYRKIIS